MLCMHIIALGSRVLAILEEGTELLTALNELLYLSRMPVVAAGLLHHLRSVLIGDETVAEPEPVHLVVIDQIATAHAGLHTKSYYAYPLVILEGFRVFALLSALFERECRSSEVAEVVIGRQRTVIDRFVHLLSVGAALPVIAFVVRMYREGQADVSLIR